MIGKVRRMHLRQSNTVREIARATSLSRNTVRKYLVGHAKHRQPAGMLGILGAYRAPNLSGSVMR